jgi:hypothetical protein
MVSNSNRLAEISTLWVLSPVIFPLGRASEGTRPKPTGSNGPPHWRAGRNAIYQLAALTIGARLAIADA